MALKEELLAIEIGFWTGGPDYYRSHVDDQCLVVFGETAGPVSRDELSKMVPAESRWNEPEIDVKGIIEPTKGFAVLTYLARAEKTAGERYQAVVSSGYAKRDGKWKLTFHQQAKR